MSAPTWDEAMDGPAPFWPASGPHLTQEQQARYHALACEYVEREANKRAAHHAADFERWSES